MKILVVNPNTSPVVLEAMMSSTRRCASPISEYHGEQLAGSTAAPEATGA